MEAQLSVLSTELEGFIQILLDPNTYADYGLAALVFIVTIPLLGLIKSVLLSVLQRLAKKTKAKFNDTLIEILDSFGHTFYVVVSVFFASQFISFPQVIHSAIYYIFLLTLVFYVVKSTQKIINYFIQLLIAQRKKEEGENEDVSLIELANQILNASLWLIAILIFLSNIGMDITPLLAGASIGGLALAFGIQAILGDVFASFSIYFDKPFKVGDYIVVGTDDGIVKKIGIKSTRIQTLRGEELIVSNKELVNSRINNFKRMKDRRVDFKLGVTYDTPVEKLEKIPKIISDIISKTDSAKFDRCHFKDYGDFSLVYVIVYHVSSRDYEKYLDTHQQINFSIAKAFKKEKIEFAYPSQTIYLKK